LSKKISDKDKKDWQDFLSKNENLPIKDEELISKKTSGILTFDLHGYSLEDANNKVEDIILKSYEKGIKKLVLITGKGIHSQNIKDPYVSKDFGILKNSVPEYIKNNNRLMSKINDIVDADIKDGGSGAFYIYLKKKL
jgi:DNA-nicking Smr family endonuclease|tara:strand:- start:589 stop:1002 length:414 start_codon:yes stop_codon:yes gene_type:complete